MRRWPRAPVLASDREHSAAPFPDIAAPGLRQRLRLQLERLALAK